MIEKIKRFNELEICKNANSILIYGRRKTGKTFFVKNYLRYDYYFFIGKGDNIFMEKLTKKGTELNYESFFSLFKNIAQEKIIAIDEFHRLPQGFLDYLHYNKPKKIILLTSTLWLATNMLEKKDSSLLGIVNPVKFSITSEIDIIKNLTKLNLSEEDLFENCVYLREPILLEFYKKNISNTVTQFLYSQKYYLKNLIGEIFSEEQKSLSNIYEGILLSISAGKNISGEITSSLFSKKIIKKDNPGFIQKHLENLVKLGLIEKIQVFNKKKFYYLITSPLLDLHFYLCEKYDYVEQEIPISFIEEVVKIKMPIHIEIFFRNLFSKLYGLKIVKINNPEIDISLLKFKKLEFLAEVKWRNNFKNKNDEIFEKLSNFNVKEKYLISKKDIKSKIKTISLKKIINLVLSNKKS